MIDFDCLGYCALCHTQIGEIVQNRIHWFPIRRTADLMLSSGSKMTVSLCEHCENELNEKNFDKLMQSVIKGWEEELKDCQMTEGEKETYRQRYYGLKIKERV